jgi:hypothetical protein
MGSLWRGYRAEMWGSYEFRPILAPSRGEWSKKEGRLAGMNDTVAGSMRG